MPDDQQPIDWAAIERDRAARAPLGPVIDWPPVTRRRPEETAQDLHAAAERLLLTDPLFAARAKLAARLAEDVLPSGVHSSVALRAAAALALLVTERPELITGEAPRGRPPVDVLTRALDPLVRVYGFTPATDGHVEAHKLARGLLGLLEGEGYEVTVRADRFATLAGDPAAVRIPLRGRCGTCRDGVLRGVESSRGEVLVGPWLHVDPSVEALHPPTAVEPL